MKSGSTIFHEIPKYQISWKFIQQFLSYALTDRQSCFNRHTATWWTCLKMHRVWCQHSLICIPSRERDRYFFCEIWGYYNGENDDDDDDKDGDSMIPWNFGVYQWVFVVLKPRRTISTLLFTFMVMLYTFSNVYHVATSGAWILFRHSLQRTTGLIHQRMHLCFPGKLVCGRQHCCSWKRSVVVTHSSGWVWTWAGRCNNYMIIW
jgi:hypothetical protein